MVRTLCVLAVILGSTLASADETASDFRGAINKCKPSCYERVSFEGRAPKIKVCARLPIHFMQERRGKAWSKLERSSAMSPIAVPGCKFPTAVPAKWKAVVAEAKKQLDLAKGDVVTIAADVDDWGIERDDLGRVTARDVLIEHYSRNHEGFDGCRAGDPFAVCEGENNAVTSFNRASYRVTEAGKLAKAGKQAECRASVWDALDQVHDARKERDRHVKDGSWKVLTYATRYDGLMNEKDMFAKLDAREAEARALWGKCGGKGEPPID